MFYIAPVILIFSHSKERKIGAKISLVSIEESRLKLQFSTEGRGNYSLFVNYQEVQTVTGSRNEDRKIIYRKQSTQGKRNFKSL